jgi:hypothetical protein
MKQTLWIHSQAILFVAYMALIIFFVMGCTGKPADRQQRVDEARAMRDAMSGFDTAAANYGAGKTPAKTQPVQVHHD